MVKSKLKLVAHSV